MSESQKHTLLIKEKAKELGFYDVGISKAQKLNSEEERLQNWLLGGNNATMDYMNNHFDKRLDPTKLVPGAKSVISLMYNYYTEQKQIDNTLKISKYAYGRDYHKVLKRKLKELFTFINDIIKPISGRAFVDSAPVLERAWAKNSGLGWIGKNSLLINPKKGSYFFLSELILDIELEYDSPIPNHCGTCRKCIDACPTSAISNDGYSIDARKCISFLTIENKNDIPFEFKDKMEVYIFGCDICQEVCPWNRFAKENKELDFTPKNGFLNMTLNDWKNLSERKYEELFFGTPVVRTKLSGLKRNIKFVIKDLEN
jgi:epoxyqueuosine reductase